MEENKKEFLEKEKYKNIFKKIKIILIILIPIIVIFLVYFFIIKIDSCDNETCFFDSLKDCKKTYFIKEDFKYSWRYLILKETSKDLCEIKVELLNVKQEPINLKILQNKEMICIIPKITKSFPENDISKCRGVLKEGLQDLIIQRMHNYLLANVQEINTSFFEPL